MGLIISKLKSIILNEEKWVLNNEGRKIFDEYKDCVLLKEIWEERVLFETRNEEEIEELKANYDYCNPTLYLMILIQSYRNMVLREEKGIGYFDLVNKEDYEFSKEWNRIVDNVKSEKVEIYLENAYFDEINLENADFSGSHLENSYFWEAHIENCCIDIAHIENVSLNSAFLNNANIRSSHLENSCFRYAQLDKSDIKFSNINCCDFLSATMDGCILQYVDTHSETEKKFNSVYSELLSFTGVRFDDAVVSIKETRNDKVRTKAIRAFSEGEVNNVRFLDPVFGREVRDQAWINHYIRYKKFKYYELAIPIVNLLFLPILAKILFWILNWIRKKITKSPKTSKEFPYPRNSIRLCPASIF